MIFGEGEGELMGLDCQPGEALTSRLIIVFELGGSGKPTRNQGMRVSHLRRLVRALFNKIQNTTVIRTSAATAKMLIKVEKH